MAQNTLILADMSRLLKSVDQEPKNICEDLYYLCLSHQPDDRENWYRNKLLCADAYMKCIYTEQNKKFKVETNLRNKE